MDAIWEYLLNHSPKLVEKSQRTPVRTSENQAEPKPAPPKPQGKGRSPLRTKLLNSKSSSAVGFQPIVTPKLPQSPLIINSIKSLRPPALTPQY